MTEQATRILCADSLPWMMSNQNVGHVITSLPDANELGIEADETYVQWFARASRLCFITTHLDCVTVFMQSDRLANGRWLSKTKLLMQVAETHGAGLIWHKIELRRAAGKIDLYRPSYRNILAFGSGKTRSGPRTPDVFGPGETIYRNAVSTEAAQVAVNLALCNDRTKPIIDPFCGRGTVPYVAKRSGAETFGIDIDKAQCEYAIGLLGGLNL